MSIDSGSRNNSFTRHTPPHVGRPPRAGAPALPFFSFIPLSEYIQWRLARALCPDASTPLRAPSFDALCAHRLAESLKKARLSQPELLLLHLALAPHLNPALLGETIAAALPESQDFPAIGGTKSRDGRYVLPTGEMALFLLAGEDPAARAEVAQLLSPTHWFAQRGVIDLEVVPPGEPRFSGKLMFSEEYLHLLTVGPGQPPRFGPNFPARPLTTDLDWKDLVLEKEVHERLRDIQDWLAYDTHLRSDWQMAAKLKRGYRALFYGPPGTGKTLTATLLGKQTGRTVLRVDLSMVVSKWIGEMEKNLAKLFERARRGEYILFFDEADALFGKRTETKSSNDRHANQGVSYLLQRIEDYPGLVVLASNFKSNIDAAFLRRFNTVVRFPFPQRAAREQLWRTILPEPARLGTDPEIPVRAAAYELAGGDIVNVVQYACLRALARREEVISWSDIHDGIRREVEKAGGIFQG